MLNPVHKIASGTDEEGVETTPSSSSIKATYNVINKIIIHTESGGDLPAELMMEGYCTPKTDTRMTVAFTSGTLRKPPQVENDEKLLKLWKDTFDGIYAKSDQERSYLESAMRKVMSYVLKMSFPSDESMRYEMKRVVHGYLDILYLDQDLRITRGNRGSVVVVER